jgi:VWFA-related protein
MTSAEHTRRAIIVLTDGVDTSSRMKIHEAIERAQKADALIYAIGIGDRYSFNVDEGVLRKIAEKTGGRAYFPRHERDLNDAFTQIQRDLREQYLVAYSPQNKARDGSYRRIEIQVINPGLKQKDLKLNYRSGYFAKTTGAEPATRKRVQDR